jgi:hypothetical protein
VFNTSLLTGNQIEALPGEPSARAFGSPVSLPGATKRMTATGPAGIGNLAYNDQVLDLVRPLRDLERLTNATGRSQTGLGDRTLDFLLGRIHLLDPERAILRANQDRQQQLGIMLQRAKRAERAGKTDERDFWLGQRNATLLLGEK